jgi:hypothetical protein
MVCPRHSRLGILEEDCDAGTRLDIAPQRNAADMRLYWHNLLEAVGPSLTQMIVGRGAQAKAAPNLPSQSRALLRIEIECDLHMAVLSDREAIECRHPVVRSLLDQPVVAPQDASLGPSSMAYALRDRLCRIRDSLWRAVCFRSLFHTAIRIVNPARQITRSPSCTRR